MVKGQITPFLVRYPRVSLNKRDRVSLKDPSDIREPAVAQFDKAQGFGLAGPFMVSRHRYPELLVWELQGSIGFVFDIFRISD